VNRLSMAEYVTKLTQYCQRMWLNGPLLEDWPRIIEGYHYCLMAIEASGDGDEGLMRTWTHLGYQRIWPERPIGFIEDYTELLTLCMKEIGIEDPSR
jgi:hypothetical protein